MPQKIVTFAASDVLLSNPFMGWQSCDKAAPNTNWPSQSSYCKFYWRDLEPKEGVYNFNNIVFQINEAKRRGQLFFFRVMISDERTSAPAWLKNKGCKGVTYTCSPDDSPTGPQWTPDYADPMFLAWHLKLLKALYAHLEINNLLQYVEGIDIGSVGLWGEWHFSGVTPAIPLPPLSVQKQIIDHYQQTFIDIQSFAQMTAPEAAAYAISKGAGWRGDGWGEKNHDTKYYPKWIGEAGAADAWKKAPVALESFGDPNMWIQRKWDITAAVNFAIDQHASYINCKAWTIKPEAMPEMARLLNRIGYRLLVKKVVLPEAMRRSRTYAVLVDVQNLGCAPIYGNPSATLNISAPKPGGVFRQQTLKGFKVMPGETTQIKFPLTLAADFPKAPSKLSITFENRGRPIRTCTQGELSGELPICDVRIA